MGNRKNAKLLELGGRKEKEYECRTSGDKAVHSGIYRVEHSHAGMEREVIIQKNMKLPACTVCGEAITFRLLQKVKPITEDPDFR